MGDLTRYFMNKVRKRYARPDYFRSFARQLVLAAWFFIAQHRYRSDIQKYDEAGRYSYYNILRLERLKIRGVKLLNTDPFFINKEAEMLLMSFLKDTFKGPDSRFGSDKIWNRLRKNKDFEEGFIESIEQFYNSKPSFISNPKIILEETIDTMFQIGSWISKECKTREEVLLQLRALIEPTIVNPQKAGAYITPLELLARGNNSDIGQFIHSDQPIAINDRPIIKQATKEDMSILSPEFVKAWSEREIPNGGCPALKHRKMAGEILLDFARLYIDVAEKVSAQQSRSFIALLPARRLRL